MFPDGEQTAGAVILVEGIALRCRDSGEKPQLVIGIGLGLLPRVVRRKDIARAVIGVENHGAGSGLAPRAVAYLFSCYLLHGAKILPLLLIDNPLLVILSRILH